MKGRRPGNMAAKVGGWLQKFQQFGFQFENLENFYMRKKCRFTVIMKTVINGIVFHKKY